MRRAVLLTQPLRTTDTPPHISIHDINEMWYIIEWNGLLYFICYFLGFFDLLDYSVLRYYLLCMLR